MINIDFQDINIMGTADTGGSSGGDLSNYYNKTEVDSKLVTKADKNEIPDVSTLASKTELNSKVDKVTGKGLSSNDYTTDEKTKLAGLVNYDDTAIKQQITDIETSIGDINTVLDSINGEIV